MTQTIQIKCAGCQRIVVMTIVGDLVSATGDHQVVTVKQSKMLMHAVNCTKGGDDGGS